MVNNIKLDEMKTHFAQITPVDKKSTQLAGHTAKQDSVTVSNGMKKLVNLVKTEASSMLDIPQTLAEIKEKVKNNTYQINFDTLSDKMLKNGILTKAGK
jgi:hypothetical protein